MTRQEFDRHPWHKGMSGKFELLGYEIAGVDFETYRLLLLNLNQMSRWVNCESVQLI